MFLHFLHLFKMSFCEIFWSTSRKKYYKSKIAYIFIYRKKTGLLGNYVCRSIFIAWKILANFCVANFYLIFCKAIVKDAVKQMLGFLGCWSFKHDIWTRCKKCNVCVNFCGFPLFPLFPNFDFLCIYGFSKIIKSLSSGGSLFL